jgi:hypothetical protein
LPELSSYGVSDEYPDTSSSALVAGSTGSPCFAVYELTLDSEDSCTLADSIAVDYSWLAAPPAPSQGLWIGLADYERNSWAWFGPAVESASEFSAAERELLSQGETFHVVLLNYSAEQLRVISMDYDYRAIPPADDQWIYFTQTDPEHPQWGTSIVRASPATGAQQVVLAGGTDESFSHPHVAGADGSLGLDFAYRMTGMSTAIFRCDPVGGNRHLVVQEPLHDVFPAGWAPDGSAFVYMRSTGHNELFNVFAYDVDTDTSGLLLADSYEVSDAIWDDTGGVEYCALIVLPFDFMMEGEIFRVWSDGPLPANALPQGVVYSQPCMPVGYCSDPVAYSVQLEGGQLQRGVVWVEGDPFHNDPRLRRALGASDEVNPWQADQLGPPHTRATKPAISSDGRYLAFLGRLYVTEPHSLCLAYFPEGHIDSYCELALNAVGRPCWYQPAP